MKNESTTFPEPSSQRKADVSPREMTRPAERTGGNSFQRWLVVVLFAAAMAWVESAVVFYLRTMIDRLEPFQPNPFPEFGGLAPAELVRELATLIMLATVGWLAGATPRTRVGYALLAFGVWDLFYYLFLKVLTGWPHSLLDWDILFLLPLPWWGPVLAPAAIASLMIVWGTLVTQFTGPHTSTRSIPGTWTICLAGIGLGLYLFMEDAIRAVTGGASATALRDLLPTEFNWPIFSLALLLMSVPVAEVCGQLRKSRLTRLPEPRSI